ncbi:MAG: cobyric acid synthase [Muribaculaceae bacterium]|nr:cobyric acid synthase [Muribaculaceae bacterium]
MRLRPIMLGGTGSDVGKSLIAAGLCRIFRQDGYSPAPFKAQNMALNSFATPDGFEIGRAQAVQAEAAGIPCSTDMNPLLLKPSGSMTSQVVLNGVPIGNRDAYQYFRNEGRGELRKSVCDAFDRLAALYNPIVMEGAGSIAEINLRDSDLVNIPMARHAGAAVILVADIDRGGVFASVYGSIMLQTPEDRGLIKGIIINKFRGDMRLFDKGRKMMEEICGVPVLGVVPYDKSIHIDEEDSVALDTKPTSPEPDTLKVRIAVVRLPYISNYTDFDILERHPQVSLFYATSPQALLQADAVIIPGSKSTISDLKFLRDEGFDKAIEAAMSRGVSVMGICGGYQMMGLTVSDPEGIEGEGGSVDGLGLLPVCTTLESKKVTRRISANFTDRTKIGDAYEIHQGRTVRLGGAPYAILEDGSEDGCIADNGCMGTYLHGILDNPAAINRLIAHHLHSDTPVHYDPLCEREREFDRLAEMLRRHLDMNRIYEIMSC